MTGRATVLSMTKWFLFSFLDVCVNFITHAFMNYKNYMFDMLMWQVVSAPHNPPGKVYKGLKHFFEKDKR